MRKIGYWLLMLLILIVLNTATIVWLVYQYLPSPQIPDLSMWDISILKSQLNLAPNQYLSIAEKATIYLFMIVGAISSALFLKWLFIDTLTQMRERVKEKSNKTWKKFKKELNNEN